MSEWRIDPNTGRAALIAPERAARPQLAESDGAASDDPFLEGNESQTPGELFAIRAPGTRPDTPGWSVRVVPNKFPAVHFGQHSPVAAEDSAQVLAGVGAHEVIIECPHMETNLGRLPVSSVVDVLKTYRERLRVHSADPRLKHAVIFKNQGQAAGATIPHSHSQLIATPFVLPDIARRVNRAREYYQTHGRSLYDDTLRDEQKCGSRIVDETDDFLVWCPRVSRLSYEMRILPKPPGRLEAAGDDLLASLGLVLKQTLRRLEVALDDPPLNFILHTAPFREPESPGDRWWVEIIPRISGIGGFEWGTVCFISTTSPEEAARTLRDLSDGHLP